MSKNQIPPLPPLPATAVPAPPAQTSSIMESFFAASPATPLVVPSGATSTAQPAGLPSVPGIPTTVPTPPPSTPSIPAVSTGGPPTPSGSTVVSVPAVPGATPNSFTTLFGASSPSSAPPPAPSPNTGTGGTNPPGLTAPTTAGVPFQEALTKGLKGSLQFGAPPKSDSPEVEPNVEAGQGTTHPSAQVTPTSSVQVIPMVPPSEIAKADTTPPQRFPHPAIAKDIGPKAAEEAKARLATATPLAPTASAGGGSGTTAASAGPTTGSSADGPRKTTTKYDPVAAGLALVEADPALMDMPIEDTDEAEIYLDFLREGRKSWAEYTDAQKYTQRVCLEMLLREAEARLAQIGLICVGATPIGLSITINEAGPSDTPEAVNKVIEKGHAEAVKTVAATMKEVAAGPAKTAIEVTKGTEGVPPELLALTDVDAALLVEGFDEDVDEGDEVFTDEEYESPKTEAAGLMARTAAEEPRHKGPTTSTGVPLTDAGIRPFVEAYAAYAVKKNLAGQGDIERRLGLDITKAGNWKSYKSEDQQSARERIINDAIGNLLAQGKAEGKATQKTPDAEQMARMRMKCSNTSVGCDSPRHSHRGASGQCYEPRCPCKGRCEAFVEKGDGGPDGGSKRPEGAGTTNAEGVGNVASIGGGPTAAPSLPAGMTGAPTAPAAPIPSERDEAVAQFRKLMTRLHCARPVESKSGQPCGWSADCHQHYTGQIFIGGNQGGHVACPGFQPKPEEREEFLALVEQGNSLGLGIKPLKGGGGGTPGEGQGGDVPGPGELGSGVPVPGTPGSQIPGNSGSGPGGSIQEGPTGAGRSAPDLLGGRVRGDAPGGVGEPDPGPAGSGQAQSGASVLPGGPGSGEAPRGVGSFAGLPPPLPPRSPAHTGQGPGSPAGGSGAGAAAEGQAAPTREDGHAEVPGPETGPEEMTVQEVVDEIAWIGGYVFEGKVVIPSDDGTLDWWPLQIELDSHEHTLARRDEIVGRMLAWWHKAIHVKLPSAPGATDGVLNPAYNLHSTSYRTVLAAKELSAQIERYARAWRGPNGEPHPGVSVGAVPAEMNAALLGKVIDAATAYLHAHEVLPEGQPDTDYVTYMEACLTWEVEVGTPWAEIRQMLSNRTPVPEQQPDDETPF